jgi:peptidase C25-like protein
LRHVLGLVLVLTGTVSVREARADFKFKEGNFPSPSTASPPDFVQAITGVGFKPKAVIFYTGGDTSLGANSSFHTSYGFATGPANQEAVGLDAQWNDPSGLSWDYQSQSDCLLLFNNGNVGARGRAHLTSFDTDGFTLTWTYNDLWRSGAIVHYIALGGTDLTSAMASSFTATTGAGTQSVTNVGFRPDFLLFLSIDKNTMGLLYKDFVQLSLGFASSPSAQGGIGMAATPNGAPPASFVRQRTDNAIVELTGTGAQDKLAAVQSFDLNGFTLNKTASVSATVIHYLALKGGAYKVGSFNKAAAVGAQPVAGVGFKPVGLVLASKDRPSNAAIETEGRISFGGSDGTSYGALWLHDINGGCTVVSGNCTAVGYTDAWHRMSTTRIIEHALIGPDGSPPSAYAAATLTSFDANGFTLNWPTNNAALDEILYVAFGAATPVYYSVGTSYPSDLKSGSPTVTLVSGTATFSVAQPANIGVGDEVTYNGGTKAYISGRTSSTVYSLRTALGVVPADIAGATVNSITRSFASLTAAVAGSSNASHLNTTNLVAANVQLNWPCYKDGAMNDQVTIAGYTTGPSHYIRAYTPYSSSEVGTSQRHTGKARTGFRLAPVSVTDSDTVIVNVSFARIDGLEIDGSLSGAPNGAGGIAIQTGATTPVDHHVSHNIVYETRNFTGIYVNAMSARVWDNVCHKCDNPSLSQTYGAFVMDRAGGTAYFYNNTAFNSASNGIANNAGTLIATNNVAMNSNTLASTFKDFAGTITQGNDVSSDTSATGTGSLISKASYAAYFRNIVRGAEDLHLLADSNALWGGYGADLRADPNLPVVDDIDEQTRRPVIPDTGADQFMGATAVTLASFAGQGEDGAVSLAWSTGAEIDNLGFNLYRSPSASGPYGRITASLVPGLGNSPEGSDYSYRDGGLVNGTTYFYELEDVETTGRTTRHGPISATPFAGGSPSGGAPQSGDGSGSGSSSGGGSGGSSSGSGSGTPASARITYGDPSAVSFRILSRSSSDMVVELRTGGFLATPLPDGSVHLEVPGLFNAAPPGQPDLPVFRSWVEAVAGRKVAVASVQSGDVASFTTPRPVDALSPEVEVAYDGTIRPARGRAPSRLQRARLSPTAEARVLQTAFQGETKKAFLEIAPLRYDSLSGEVLLAKTLTIRVSFLGLEPEERALGGARGRKAVASGAPRASGRFARFSVDAPGLYAVSFEEVFTSRRRPLPTSSLRLSRQGKPVAFHTEPLGNVFGPGSTLFFLSEGSSLNPYGPVVYELSQAEGGLTMSVGDASPSRPAVGVYTRRNLLEQNRLYQAALLDAPSLWLWDYVESPNTKTYPFTVTELMTTEPARLAVDLQGGSDFEADPDHHVRVKVNGTEVGEASWDGKLAQTIKGEVPAGVLLEGPNELEVENVGDTAAGYSLVILDRFTVEYPRLTVAENGRLEGGFDSSGTVTVSGFAGPSTSLLDVTDKDPRWMRGAAAGSGVRFHVDAGHRYLAVDSSGLLHPTVSFPQANTLRDTSIQADYILLTPREFLPAAMPLLDHRRAEELSVEAVTVEDVYDQFGFGEPSPQAIKDFLSFAYHQWRSPSPRYVLLLGDTTYDPKDYLAKGIVDRIPSPLLKTTFLWTVSDPSYAAVNGDDLLPDLAIGRLPAGSLAEAQVLVQKLLDFETAGFSMNGPQVLVADNPDLAGNFEQDADEIAATLLAGKTVEKIYLAQLGDAARPTILDAFNRGASLISYLGHGSTVVWASENVLNNQDVPGLLLQPQQPFLFTMNCLNGYFQIPTVNSLAEQLVKAEGKGAIAAFAPSGLSVNDAAHLYHEAFLREILSGHHQRIGDALLAAQVQYANSGAFPELLDIYHLFGDPAMTLR